MPLDGSDRCPICGKNFRSAGRLGTSDAHRVSCQLCGDYDISSAMRADLRSTTTPELLPFLAAHTRQAFEFEGKPIRIDNDWAVHAETHRHTSVHQRAHKLLRLIESRAKQPGEYVKIESEWDYPLVDAVNGEALRYYTEYWNELGCLTTMSVSLVRLTVKGWDRLDPASGGAGIPGRVFGAMSFDPSLDAISKALANPASK
jgi:hypothetical protein